MAREYDSDLGEYVTRATPIFTGNNNWTLSAWFNFGVTGTYKSILFNGVDGGFGQGFGLAINDANSLAGLFPYVTWVGGSGALSSGTWYHGLLVRDAGTAQLYLNGSTAGSSSSSTPYTPDGSSDTSVGVRRNSAPGFDWYFNGSIAEAAMWNIALSLSQIQGLAKGYSPWFFRRGLLFFKPFTLDSAVWDAVDGVSNWTSVGTIKATHPRIIYPTGGL